MSADDAQPSVRPAGRRHHRRSAWVLTVAGALTLVAVGVSVSAILPGRDESSDASVPPTLAEAADPAGSAVAGEPAPDPTSDRGPDVDSDRDRDSDPTSAPGPDSDADPGPGPDSDADPDATTRAETPGAQEEASETTRSDTSAQSALADLVAVRGRALRTRDLDLLTEVYVPGAQDLQDDRTMLSELETDPVTGQHAFSALEMAVEGDPALASETGAEATVVATVSATGLEGEEPDTQTVKVTLANTAQGWRINDVEPQ